MTTTVRRRWFAALALFCILLFAAFLWARPLLNIGAGYAAKHACSCHFLQGRELDEIREHDLNFSVLGRVSLSADDRVVDASFFGLVPRRAVYREGIGCTLINDRLKPVAKIDKGAGAGAVNGGGRAVRETNYLSALNEALDFGMQPVPGGGARGIVILQDGIVVGERYAEGYDANTLLLGWSMTKSLTGMAFGAHRGPAGTRRAADIAEITGRDELYPAWATDARANIELADLLRMHSGLGWNEAYGSLSDATIMLHEYADMPAYAAGMPIAEPPGEIWNYSSGTTNILVDLLARDLAKSGTSVYERFDELYTRVAPSLLIEPDQSGNPVGSSYGWATARDWARLGQFMLQDGVWAGDTLLQPGWIDFMRTPAEGSNGTYGAQLWLPGPGLPSLPGDAYMMRGFQDQRVIVVPSHNTVIARLGHNDDKSADFEGLVKRVLEALP